MSLKLAANAVCVNPANMYSQHGGAKVIFSFVFFFLPPLY